MHPDQKVEDLRLSLKVNDLKLNQARNRVEAAQKVCLDLANKQKALHEEIDMLTLNASTPWAELLRAGIPSSVRDAVMRRKLYDLYGEALMPRGYWPSTMQVCLQIRGSMQRSHGPWRENLDRDINEIVTALIPHVEGKSTPAAYVGKRVLEIDYDDGDEVGREMMALLVNDDLSCEVVLLRGMRVTKVAGYANLIDALLAIDKNWPCDNED